MEWDECEKQPAVLSHHSRGAREERADRCEAEGGGQERELQASRNARLQRLRVALLKGAEGLPWQKTCSPWVIWLGLGQPEPVGSPHHALCHIPAGH